MAEVSVISVSTTGQDVLQKVTDKIYLILCTARVF